MITKTEIQKDGAGKEITEQKYNHLAPAEMMKEDNYNKIDGNVERLPVFFTAAIPC